MGLCTVSTLLVVLRTIGDSVMSKVQELTKLKLILMEEYLELIKLDINNLSVELLEDRIDALSEQIYYLRVNEYFNE